MPQKTDTTSKTSKKEETSVARTLPIQKKARPKLTAKAMARAASIWTVVGALIVLGAFLTFAGYIGNVILFVSVGAIVAFICSPIVNALERVHVPRSAGALIALVIVLGICACVVGFLGPLFIEQLIELLTRVPIYSREILSWVNSVLSQVNQNDSVQAFAGIQTFLTSFSQIGTDFANQMLKTITEGIIPNILSTANNLFMVFLGLVLAFWLAKDYPKMIKECSIIAGPKHREGMTLLFAVLSRSVSGYMKGIVITSVFGGVLAWIGFTIVGQPYAALMGILTALLHFIPVIGPFISAAIATITSFFVSPLCALWTLIVAIIAENITDNVLSPVVMKSAVRVHPAMSLLAIVVGYALGGGIGMAVSIPISAAIKGIFVYYFETKTGRQLVSPDGAFFEGRAYVFDNGRPAPSFDALDDDTFYVHSKVVVENEEKNLEQQKKHLKKEKTKKKTVFFKRGKKESVKDKEAKDGKEAKGDAKLKANARTKSTQKSQGKKSAKTSTATKSSKSAKGTKNNKGTTGTKGTKDAK